MAIPKKNTAQNLPSPARKKQLVARTLTVVKNRSAAELFELARRNSKEAFRVLASNKRRVFADVKKFGSLADIVDEDYDFRKKPRKGTQITSFLFRGNLGRPKHFRKVQVKWARIIPSNENLRRVCRLIYLATGVHARNLQGGVPCCLNPSHEAQVYGASNGDLFFRCVTCGQTFRSVEYLALGANLTLRQAADTMFDRGIITARLSSRDLEVYEFLESFWNVLNFGRKHYETATGNGHQPRLFGDWAWVLKQNLWKLASLLTSRGQAFPYKILPKELFLRIDRNACGRMTALYVYSINLSLYARVLFEPNELAMSCCPWDLYQDWNQKAIVCRSDAQAMEFEGFCLERQLDIPVFSLSHLPDQPLDVGRFSHIYWVPAGGCSNIDALIFDRSETSISVITHPSQLLDSDDAHPTIWQTLEEELAVDKIQAVDVLDTMMGNQWVLPHQKRKLMVLASKKTGLPWPNILEALHCKAVPDTVDSHGNRWRIVDGQYWTSRKNKRRAADSSPVPWFPITNFSVQLLWPVKKPFNPSVYVALLRVGGQKAGCVVDIEDSPQIFFKKLQTQASALGLPPLQCKRTAVSRLLDIVLNFHDFDCTLRRFDQPITFSL